MISKRNRNRYLIATLASLACVATTLPAQAQIIVRDNDVEDAVISAEEEIVAAINDRHAERKAFEEDFTDDYYEDAIERLNAVIDSLSIVAEEERDATLFEGVDAEDQTLSRTAILAVSEGLGTTFGLASLPDTDVDNMDAYLSRYGYLKPTEIYPEGTNLGLRNQLIDEQKALYYADALVGEIDSARQTRYDVYESLLLKAKNSDDVHEALDINNALLIENGRNLALLIHLQAAQLNTNTAQLRNKTRDREATANIFGLRGDGPS